jgi:acetate kinase
MPEMSAIRMTDTLLLLNAGSSSLKFALYPPSGETPFVRGQIEKIGGVPRFSACSESGDTIIDQELEADADIARCLEFLLRWLSTQFKHCILVGAGHRVVHGGERLSTPVLIDDAIIRELETLIPFARTHQPYEIAAIKALAAINPALRQVACFDTTFHFHRPWQDRTMAIPRELSESGMRRYGFHGLSYEYIAGRLPEVLGARAQGRVIVAHLGSGASLCAMRNCKSVATTMGLTTLDGLMMSTRSGAIDPGALLYAIQERGMSADELSDTLFKKSGLLGVSGVSNDMRELLASPNPHAKQAVELFVYRALREIGGLASVLGGVDALVFTAGIGERSSDIRAMICDGLRWLGVEIDESANRAHQTIISAAASKISLCVIPTNEEAVIARNTAQLLGLDAKC